MQEGVWSFLQPAILPNTLKKKLFKKVKNKKPDIIY